MKDAPMVTDEDGRVEMALNQGLLEAMANAGVYRKKELASRTGLDLRTLNLTAKTSIGVVYKICRDLKQDPSVIFLQEVDP